MVDGEVTAEEIYKQLVAQMAERFGPPVAGTDQLLMPHPPPGPRPAHLRPHGPADTDAAPNDSFDDAMAAVPNAGVVDIRQLELSVPDTGRKADLPQCPIILLMGGPGSGRSEQAAKLCARYPGFKHLSVSDLAKAQALQAGDADAAWGMMATLVQAGEAGAEDVRAEMVRDEMGKLSAEEVHCIILEGYPRNGRQLEDFNSHIGRADLAVLLDCEELYMTLRLLERGRQDGRVEDNLAAIARRMAFFKDETLPVVRHLDDSGRLLTVLGDRDREEVFYELCSLIDFTFFPKVPTEAEAVPAEAEAVPTEGPEAVEEEILPARAALLGEDDATLPDGAKKGEADALKQCKVVFVTGGPGSGKGTQCEKILNDFDVGHVSTGDLIRAEVETGSERAKQMSEVMEKGELVSLDIVLELLREHLVKNASQHKGFLVDGFPREIDQATRFEKEVVECLCMLYMDASEEEMKSRIMERAKTSGRADDNEETIAKRIETFKSHNDTIVKHFEEKGKLITIDCNSTDIDAIYANVRAQLEKAGLELKKAENANGEAPGAAAAATEEAAGDAKGEEEKEKAKGEEETAKEATGDTPAAPAEEEKPKEEAAAAEE